MIAHGLGGRSDLPLPVWLFAYGAGSAVLITFAALAVLWPRPRLAAAAAGRELGSWAQAARRPATAVLRAVGLFVFAVVLVAALWGADDGASNISPYVVYVTFWVGLQLASTVLGDVWRAANPLDTLVRLTLGRRLPERTPLADRVDPGLWPAAAMLLSFAWLELAYHEPASPRVIGVWLVAYTVATLTGTALWGRWFAREGEGFAALFGLLGALGPLWRDPGSGRLRIRWPLTGLSGVVPRRGLDALVLVALGSTTFDGVTRLDWWSRDVVGARQGWERTLVFTVGLLFVIAVVALVWSAATRLSALVTDDDPAEVGAAYLPSLVPIVVAYSIAHYFSLFVYESYNVVALSSDPFGEGWDLFGTADVFPNYRLLSTTLIAWVQAAAIVVGHVAGVVVAHDRAVERHRRARAATRSQWPLIAAMVAYTVGGLLLLLGA